MNKLLVQTIAALQQDGWELTFEGNPATLWRPGQQLVVTEASGISLDYRVGTSAKGYKTCHKAAGLSTPLSVVRRCNEWTEQEFYV